MENPWKICEKEVPESLGVENIVLGQFDNGLQRIVSYQPGPDIWFDVEKQESIDATDGLVLWRYQQEGEEDGD